MATAIAFAEPGVRLSLLARSPKGLERAARAVEEAGGSALSVVADVRERTALEAGVERAVAAQGPLDVAVVNAGAAAYGSFADTDPEDFDRTVETTLLGAANTVRLVLPHLEDSGGALVVVGSVAGQIPLPMLAAYTAAKHGLRGFVDVLQVELRERGSRVSVSLVSPGPVDTPFWRNVATQDGRLPPDIPGAYPPEDVARAIVDCARNRRRGRTVGGLMVAAELAHSTLRPLSDRALAALAHWARTSGEPGPGGRAIHSAAGAGVLRAGLPAGRPSALIRLFDGAGQAARRLAGR
jgi:short-subunit dehydrogenase